MLVTQSCLTLCDPMDCSPPGSSLPGIFQARILEWVAIPFSRGPSWPRDWNRVTCIGRWILYQLSHQGSPDNIFTVAVKLDCGHADHTLDKFMKIENDERRLTETWKGLWTTTKVTPPEASQSRTWSSLWPGETGYDCSYETDSCSKFRCLTGTLLIERERNILSTSASAGGEILPRQVWALLLQLLHLVKVQWLWLDMCSSPEASFLKN